MYPKQEPPQTWAFLALRSMASDTRCRVFSRSISAAKFTADSKNLSIRARRSEIELECVPPAATHPTTAPVGNLNAAAPTGAASEVPRDHAQRMLDVAAQLLG